MNKLKSAKIEFFLFLNNSAPFLINFASWTVKQQGLIRKERNCVKLFPLIWKKLWGTSYKWPIALLQTVSADLDYQALSLSFLF